MDTYDENKIVSCYFLTDCLISSAADKNSIIFSAVFTLCFTSFFVHPDTHENSEQPIRGAKKVMELRFQ